ncbi:hypothetical protein ABEF92_008196 [Exophiala dermatitidis]|uniref:Uncharacterized protein n=1 Tax=Exophiala dermatitidis (strain ATCC 34100 / CBS 525.76 / NIH/UT8656) TaxID=858893 RepID=H6BS43_EXODN|nr:uncharacterized protein HMPREF1120_02274 [Exophiala dermatitidis NIH/UT8656]EHY54098.1 hypothetical protein HMPREF1120_02274 [Exophiala dermatitidis NIH/UT8656]
MIFSLVAAGNNFVNVPKFLSGFVQTKQSFSPCLANPAVASALALPLAHFDTNHSLVCHDISNFAHYAIAYVPALGMPNRRPEPAADHTNDLLIDFPVFAHALSKSIQFT